MQIEEKNVEKSLGFYLNPKSLKMLKTQKKKKIVLKIFFFLDKLNFSIVLDLVDYKS